MSIQLRAAAFELAAVQRIFKKRREKAAGELEATDWARLFGLPANEEYEEDEDGGGIRLDHELVDAMRSTLADVIAGRPIGELAGHTWEDAFFAPCIKHGTRLPTEFFDRIGPGTIESAENILVEVTGLLPGFLDEAIFRSPPPLPLPPPTPGMNLGFIAAERVNKWFLLVDGGPTLDSGDREALGGAVLLRYWIQRASFQYSILLLLD